MNEQYLSLAALRSGKPPSGSKGLGMRVGLMRRLDLRLMAVEFLRLDEDMFCYSLKGISIKKRITENTILRLAFSIRSKIVTRVKKRVKSRSINPWRDKREEGGKITGTILLVLCHTRKIVTVTRVSNKVIIELITFHPGYSFEENS